MNDLSRRIAALTPEQRAVFEQRLKQQGLSIPKLQTIPRRPDQASGPLSFAQQRLWFLQQIDPESPSYNGTSAVRLSGQLDVTALERSLNLAIERHEALRTTFAPLGATDDQPVQIIAPRLELHLPVVDLSAQPIADPEAAIVEWARDEFRQPFDLRRGPLLRATLLRLADNEHVLLVTLHHIITDGWSTELLIADVIAIYTALVAGRPPEDAGLAELPVQYADFAAWQREQLQNEQLAAQLSYWRQQLSGIPDLLNLPAERPRPPVKSDRGAIGSFVLETPLPQALTALAQHENVTLFMLLLSAFYALLQRYSGQHDLLVGTTVSGRNRSELRNVMGFFANTLVLRADLSGDPTFRQLVQRVRAVVIEAFGHQDLPFELLVEQLNPERSLSYTPLFQVGFSLQNEIVQERDVAGITMRPLAIDNGTSKLDLSLLMWEGPGRLSGTVEYSTDLFDPATIERMNRHLQQLLAAIAANPDQRLSTIVLLTEAEQQQIQRWNATAGAYPEDSCIHQLIAAQAARSPDTTAVIFADGNHEPVQLSYAELDRRANQLAHRLRAEGIAVESRVGLCMERSPEMIVGLLGIFKAGGVYVPLDPDYPELRLRQMLDDAEVALVLTQQRLVAQLEPLTGATPLLALDAAWPAIAQEPQHSPTALTQPDNLAYIIFTSGSSGRPKGAQLHHRGLSNLAQAQLQFLGMQPGDRILQWASLNFDGSVFEIVLALRAGATLCLAPAASLLPGAELAAVLHDLQISTAVLPPAALSLLPDTADLPALHTLIVAGEACSPDLVARWATPQRRFLNLYGPTEATVWATGGACQPQERVTIGQPILNTQTYVLDARLRPVPIGVPGELHLGGVQLARGYLNRPALTAEKFIPDPFSHPEGTRPGARLYRTGDLARWLPNGTLEFLGRIDQQVKVRGLRIELGEIEAALLEHPAVREVAVIARSQQLAAYVVPKENLDAQRAPGTKNLGVEEQRRRAPSGHGTRNQEQTGTEISPRLSQRERGLGGEGLRQHLSARLPEYMLPSFIVLLESLPRLPNGKLDRKALPDLSQTALTPQNSYVAPRTIIEQQLATIWSALLGRAQIGIHDHFFMLGGHSLLATQVLSQVRAAFQVDVSLRALFADPTIAGLAERIAAAQPAPPVAALAPIQAVPRDQHLVLSFSQERLWMLDQILPGNLFYNMWTAVRLRGRLDRATLERCLDEVIRRHEVLRTTFAPATPATGDQPTQMIAPQTEAAHISLAMIDLSGHEQPADELQHRALSLIQQPFDLQRGPLLRAALFELDENEHVLVFVLHHIVADGWSLGVLVRELITLYSAGARGESLTHALPELPFQYADFAAWQRGWLQDQLLQEQLDYWRGQLRGAPPAIELPTDYPRPPARSSNGASFTRTLPSELAQSLDEASQRSGVTLFMAVLAAFAVLLQRYNGQSDLLIGTPIANRTRHDLEGLIGCFINTLVLRVDLSGDPSLHELLDRVREMTLDAYTHQDLPFERLVAELQPARDLSRTPLFQVMFVMQNMPIPALELPDLAIDMYPIDSGTADYDLKLELVETAQGTATIFQYNTDLFAQPTIARMCDHLLMVLHALAATPERRLSSIKLTSTAEQQQLLAWNTATVPVHADDCLHTRFAAQAARTPDAIAVICDEQTLRYAELEARANQLAHLLQARGVGPESIVGVCLPRSLDLVVALLAVLKAGGAYLPLDPVYPPDRRSFILRDAHAALLLTDATLAADLPELDLPVVCLETIQLCEQPDTLPPNRARPDNLAYVIYTSGSTGQPKGVSVPHANVIRLLTATDDWFNFGPADVWTFFHSVAFDFSVWEIWGALLTGGRLVVVPYLVSRSPAAFVELVQQTGVTVLNQTPSAFRQFIAAEAARELNAPPLTLRAVIFGGEALDLGLLQPWIARHGSERPQLVNMYGITETTVHVTYRLLWAEDLPQRRSVIGQTIPDLQLYVLDEQLEPTPIGVSGELYVGGAGLARGYLGQAMLTAQRFIPHPWADSPGARLYKTGDLARYLPDGDLEYLGRRDQQIKLRGFRIELGEIESVLRQHEAVRDAVVLVRGAADNHQLVAYVVEEQRTTEQRTTEQKDNTQDSCSLFSVLCSPQELRDYLKQHLPDYMVPALFVMLDALPLTPNGKLDRQALPEPDTSRPDLEHSYVAPRTPIEEALAMFWADVLGLQQVGVEDNFFELGGHSQRAILLLSRVREAFQVALPVQTMFESTTVASLAAALVQHERQAGRTEKIARLMLRIKQTSPEDVQTTLAQHRRRTT